MLRGLAALLVVTCHWQNFFRMGLAPVAFDMKQMPFYDAFSLLYRNAWMGVDLFFILSGFVFYALYMQAIRKHQMRPLRYAWLRLSRLYPLHALTLVVVLSGQWVYMRAADAPFCFLVDGWHLVLNLLMASSWGLESYYSFNGPFWSVSVEVILYAIFFALAWYGMLDGKRAVLLILAGHALGLLYSPMSRGISSFFMGCLVFVIYEPLMLRQRPVRMRVVGGCVAAWFLYALIVANPEWFDLRPLPFVWRFHGALTKLLYVNYPLMVVLPTIVLVLVIVETALPHLFAPLVGVCAFLGSISYSAYLWHFPLQLLLAIYLQDKTYDVSQAYTGWFMVCFYTVLVVVSTVSYYRFERPVQQWLRQII